MYAAGPAGHTPQLHRPVQRCGDHLQAACSAWHVSLTCYAAAALCFGAAAADAVPPEVRALTLATLMGWIIQALVSTVQQAGQVCSAARGATVNGEDCTRVAARDADGRRRGHAGVQRSIPRIQRTCAVVLLGLVSDHMCESIDPSASSVSRAMHRHSCL